MSRVRTWLKRYLPAEALGIGLAIAGAALVQQATGNMLFAAYAGVACDYVGYYSWIFFLENVIGRRLAAVKDILLEFGPAEVLDFFLVRPGMLWLFPLFVRPYSLGVFVGSVVASALFYVPTIIIYELRAARRTQR